MKDVAKEFKQFLLRGNVVDLSVGVVIGAAFGTFVNAIVSDLINPFISLIVRIPNLNSLSFTVAGSNFLYGHIVSSLISFVLIAATIFFFIVKPVNLLVSKSHKEPPNDPTTKKCPECLSEIPIDAKRCSACTQVVTYL